jgi:hypothetical protein
MYALRDELVLEKMSGTGTQLPFLVDQKWKSFLGKKMPNIPKGWESGRKYAISFPYFTY